MQAQLLDGKVMAAELEEELKKRVEALKEKGYTPGLTVILVGDDPASQTYVSNKEKACARLGIRSRTLRMPAASNAFSLAGPTPRISLSEISIGTCFPTFQKIIRQCASKKADPIADLLLFFYAGTSPNGSCSQTGIRLSRRCRQNLRQFLMSAVIPLRSDSNTAAGRPPEAPHRSRDSAPPARR